MGIELLGPLRVDGTVVALQRRDQVVLSALAVRSGDVLSADQLAEALWGETPPGSWPKQIHGSVLRLRRSLGAGVIETTSAGYRLAVGDGELDCHRFEELIARGRALSADAECDRAAVAFGRALELWRGAPFDVLDGWSPGRIEAARLDEMRLSAEESLLDARLAAGEHRDVVATAEARVAEAPLREHRWAILATALYRCGRQADALRALRTARLTLVEQLGIEPGAELVALEQAILAQDEALLAVPAPPTVSQHCPYKGLVPYDVADSEMFFGRDSEIAACLERLNSTPLLVVTGPSGCGKSSLVRAGLIPALQRAGHSLVVFLPGADPEAAMTNAVASSESSSPVVVVDQFEELFTLDDVSAERARSLCARLAVYATDTAPVVVTVRADHVAALAVDETFASLAERGLHLVKPLGGDSLRQAIERPAAAAGLRLEPGLIDLLVRDCEGEPGALPLLSHALSETWRRRDGRVLTVETYRATGEIRGAVARSADRLYESLPADQRPKLRSMLLRLVATSPDGDPVRSRIPTRSLGGDADRDRVLGMLVQARLVTTEKDSVELAHEALARAWPRLRSWLDEDAAGQRILRHLATAADGWESLGRPTSELYRGARLEAALEWQTTTPDLTAAETAFLDASVAAAASEHQQLAERARQQARQNRRLRRSLIGVAVLLIAALVGGLLAYQQRQTAQRNEQAAQQEERQAALTALTSNAAALRTNRRDLAALLAVEAHRLAPSAATRSALFGTFTAAPGLTRIVHTDVDMPSVSADITAIPNSDVVVVGDGFGGADLIDTVTGERRHLEGPGEEPGYVWFLLSADGRYAASTWSPAFVAETEADNYSLFTTWDLSTGERRFEPVRIPFVPGRLAVSPDGTLVAISEVDTGTLRIYNGVSGKLRVDVGELPRPEGFEGHAASAPVAFLPDGSLVVGSMAGPLRIIDPADGSELERIESPPLTTNEMLWLTKDGTHAVTLGSNNGVASVSTFDLEAGQRVTPEPAPMYPNCNAVAYAERIGAILCATWDGRVLAFDVATGAELSQRLDPQQGPVCGLALTADGTRLIEVTSCLAGGLTFAEWRLDGGGAVSRLVGTQFSPGLQQYGFGGDQSALVVSFASAADEDGVMHVIDPATGDDRSFPGVYGLVPTDEPNLAVTVFADDGTLGTYDVDRHEAVGPRIDPGFEISNFWMNGNHVLVKGQTDDGRIRLQGFDLESGAPVGPAIDVVEGGDIIDIVIVGDVMYTIQVDSRWHIERRDVSTGDVISDSAEDYRNVASNGEITIASTVDGRIFEADPVTLQPIGVPFPGTTGPASGLKLSSDGTMLMVRGDDETLHFYDVATRTPLGDPIDLNRFFMDSEAVLRADGLQAAAMTGQGIVVWDLHPEHWIEEACQIAGRNLTRAEWDQYIGDLAPYRATCPTYVTS